VNIYNEIVSFDLFRTILNMLLLHLPLFCGIYSCNADFIFSFEENRPFSLVNEAEIPLGVVFE
jgi:hypothetical protein